MSPKPILFIYQTNDLSQDSCFEIVKNLPGIVFCQNEESEIIKSVAFIVENYDSLKRNSVRRSNLEEINEFEINKIKKQFLNIVSSVYDDRQS